MLSIVERLIADWFRHETYGVNALAAQLPRTRVDAGTDDAPPTVTIYGASEDTEEGSDESVMLKLEPPAVPALVVAAFRGSPVAERGYQIANDIELAVFFMVEDTADPMTTNRAAETILRAAKLSLFLFNKVRLSREYRALNGIAIARIDRTVEHRALESNGRYKTPGLLEVHAVAGDAAIVEIPALKELLAASA